jgi:hypothetical protein
MKGEVVSLARNERRLWRRRVDLGDPALTSIDSAGVGPLDLV